jgi:hypothetical protein
VDHLDSEGNSLSSSGVDGKTSVDFLLLDCHPTPYLADHFHLDDLEEELNVVIIHHNLCHPPGDLMDHFHSDDLEEELNVVVIHHDLSHPPGDLGIPALASVVVVVDTGRDAKDIVVVTTLNHL